MFFFLFFFFNFLVRALRHRALVGVAAGDSHTIAWSVSGSVYSFGANQFGQLGFSSGDGKDDFSNKPQRVKSLQDSHIVSVVCGSFHSLALSFAGSLYAWGSNQYGQCGISTNTNTTNMKISDPVVVQEFLGNTVVDFAAGSRHSIIVRQVR